MLVVTVLVIAVGPVATVAAEDLTVDEAVSRALSGDPRIQSALLEAAAARSSVEEAQWSRLPSLSVSAGYTRLSHVSSSISFGSAEVSLDSQDNAYSLQANLQYPVFAGYRLRESITLAELAAQGKAIGVDATRSAVAFETERAYWEALRAENIVAMMRENLSLTERNRDVTRRKLEQGTVLNADLLEAEMRCDQAEMDLQDAIMRRDRAMLMLRSLVDPEGSQDLSLVSEPGSDVTIDGSEQDLVKDALEARPELLAATLAVDVADANVGQARSALYPTMSVTGNYTYANPNSRVAFQSDPAFTGTWMLGAQISYDLGGLPAHRSAIDTREAEVRMRTADADRTERVVTQDVRTCLLVYNRTRADLDLVSGMVDQAREHERVVAQQVRLGAASDVDQLTASVDRLRSEYAVVNKAIDLQIAAADLRRAAAIQRYE